LSAIARPLRGRVDPQTETMARLKKLLPEKLDLITTCFAVQGLQPAYFIVFAIATIILLLAVPMLAIVKGYAGLCKTAPPKRDNATVHDCEKTAGSGKPENLAHSPAERSGGGFANSPDVPASVLGPWIVYSLHAGYRVECETSGLADRRLSSSILLDPC